MSWNAEMSSLSSPGLYLHQVVAPPPPPPRLTSITAFLGLAPRGPLHDPQRVESWSHFVETYGSIEAGLDLAPSVYGFFRNGGRVCYVVRLAGDMHPDRAGRAALRRGLAALEDQDGISLVAAPDLALALGVTGPDLAAHAEAQRLLVDHCRRMGDRFAILDCPAQDSGTPDPAAELASGYIPELQAWEGGENAAVYFPRLWTPQLDGHPISRARGLPPCGFIAGLMARSDALEGVHRSPANAPVHGVTGLQFPVTERTLRTLAPLGVNVIRALPGRGIRPWGARTLARDPAWRYIAVRRTLLTIKQELAASLVWATFEPNDTGLQRRVAAALSGYMGGLYRTGVLAGASSREAFFVQCDAELNTPDSLARGELVARVGFAPIYPSEFIVATIVRTPESLELSVGT